MLVSHGVRVRQSWARLGVPRARFLALGAAVSDWLDDYQPTRQHSCCDTEKNLL